MLPSQITINTSKITEKHTDGLGISLQKILREVLAHVETDKELYTESYEDEDGYDCFKIKTMEFPKEVLDDMVKIAKAQEIDCFRKNSTFFMTEMPIDLQKFMDEVTWSDINYSRVSYKLVETFPNDFDKENFLDDRKNKMDLKWLSENINLFMDRGSILEDIPHNITLPEWFIETHLDKINLHSVADYQKLSEAFMRKHWKRFVKEEAESSLCMSQKLSQKFIADHAKEVSWGHLSDEESKNYKRLTETFVRKFIFEDWFEKNDAINIIYSIPCSEKLVLDVQEHYEIKQLTDFKNIKGKSLDFILSNIKNIGYNKALRDSDDYLGVFKWLLERNQRFDFDIIKKKRLTRKFVLENLKLLCGKPSHMKYTYKDKRDNYWLRELSHGSESGKIFTSDFLLKNPKVAKALGSDLVVERVTNEEELKALLDAKLVKKSDLKYLESKVLKKLSRDFVISNLRNLDKEEVLHHNPNLTEADLRKHKKDLYEACLSYVEVASRKNCSKEFKNELIKYLG